MPFLCLLPVKRADRKRQFLNLLLRWAIHLDWKGTNYSKPWNPSFLFFFFNEQNKSFLLYHLFILRLPSLQSQQMSLRSQQHFWHRLVCVFISLASLAMFSSLTLFREMDNSISFIASWTARCLLHFFIHAINLLWLLLDLFHGRSWDPWCFLLRLFSWTALASQGAYPPAACPSHELQKLLQSAWAAACLLSGCCWQCLDVCLRTERLQETAETS